MLALLLPLLLAAEPATPPPTPDCLSAQGRTACGYQCRSTHTSVACATTPFGFCTVLQGAVRCWDPPLAVIHHPPRVPVSPSCRQGGDAVACGYHCTVHEGRVACARTPYGLCSVQNGLFGCWDPPDEAIHQHGAKLPPAQCRAVGGKIACGYSCMSSASTVACTQTPSGRCTVQLDQVTCWDPPSLLHCEHTSPH